MPGDWRSLAIGTGKLQHTVLRYGGASGATVLSTGTSPRATFTAVRIDHASKQAVQLWSHLGALRNLVIYKAGGIGMNIARGNFNVVHATMDGLLELVTPEQAAAERGVDLATIREAMRG